MVFAPLVIAKRTDRSKTCLA